MIPRPSFLWLQRGLLIFGLLLLGIWCTTAFESRAYQYAESQHLSAVLRARVTPIDAAFAGEVPTESVEHASIGSGVLGRIEIPRLGIAAIVAEGYDVKTLARAIGHISSTALPGNPGNCALAGHRDTFLRGLGAVRTNDVIRITTLDGTYRYQVEWTEVVAPRRVDVLDSTATRSLTLITCYPFVFVGHAPKRFVVRARQVDAVPGSTTADGRNAVRAQGLAAEGR